MKCASDQRSIDSSLVSLFFFRKRKSHLFKRRIKPNNSDFREFSFSDILCPGAGNFALLFCSQPIFDYVRLCVDVSCLSILHKCISSFGSLVENRTKVKPNNYIGYWRKTEFLSSTCSTHSLYLSVWCLSAADANCPTKSPASNKQLTINNCVVSAYPAYRLEKRKVLGIP